MARLRKGRRVEDDEIVIAAFLLGHFRKQVEYVSLFSCHNLFQPVAADVFIGHGDGFFRYVDSRNGRGPALRGVEGEGPRMGKAV